MIPTPRSGGGLRFPVFGFPVRIHASFLLIVLLIGLSGPSPDLRRAFVWLVVVAVSVLVHELGHAFAARFAGARPTIDLYALGGLTAFTPPRPLGRLQNIGISLAGPLAGFALGLLVLSSASAFGVGRLSPFAGAEAPLADVVVGAAVWVNIYWGFVNLLPILPLDGGNVLRSLLPGGEATRDRWAALLSLAFCGLGAFLLVRAGLWGLVLLPGLLAVVNFQLLGSTTAAARGPDEHVRAVLGSLDRAEPGSIERVAEVAAAAVPSVQDRIKVTAVEILARQRRAEEARWALGRLPGRAHPALYALAEAAAGDPQALEMLDEMVRAQPAPPVARYGYLARIILGRAHEIPAAHERLPASARSLEVLAEAQYLAHVAGDFRGAAAIGELLSGACPEADPWALYNTACSWARAGERDRALARLREAVEAGWSDAAHLDADEDLAPLWVTDEFRDLRRRVAGRLSTSG